MTYQLKCPACRNSLYLPKFEECDEDFLEGICTGCKYKYALIHTEVSSFASSVEALQTNKYRRSAQYRRIYQIRLLKADDTLKSLQFSTLGQAERISALPGDELLLLYVMRGKALEDLVLLENYTTGKSHLLIKPGALARSSGFSAGVLTLFATGILATGLNLPMNRLFLAAAIPSSVGVGAYVTRLKDPKTKDRKELARLGSERRLLLQKFELEQRTQELRTELEANQRIIDRLKGLRRKMLNAAEELYANRIETVSKGIDVLHKQLDMTQDLITGYTQIIEVLAIEYETSRLAEQIPEDVSGQILTRLEELKAIEAKKEELALLVNPHKLLSYREQY